MVWNNLACSFSKRTICVIWFCTHVVWYTIAGAISRQLCLQKNSHCTVMVWNNLACSFSKRTICVIWFCTHVVRYTIAGAISRQPCLQKNSRYTVMVWNNLACSFSKGTLSCCTLKRFSFHGEATDAPLIFSWGIL